MDKLKGTLDNTASSAKEQVNNLYNTGKSHSRVEEMKII